MMEMRNLRRVRQRKALSQESLSKLSGVALSTIIRAEKGNPARYVTVRKLADTLGVAPEDLATPREDAEEPPTGGEGSAGPP